MIVGTFVRTLVSYGIGGLVGLVCLVPCFSIAAMPESIRFNNCVYYWFTHFFYAGMMRATFLPVMIEGQENMPAEPAVFVANHQSALDIPLLGMVLGQRPHVWLFLERFARIPVFGFIIRRMNIVVDHSGLRKLVGSIENTLSVIDGRDQHVLLFPEGGRYIDGAIHNFLSGFALIAKATNRPVVPVMLFNVNKVYPPKSFLIRYNTLRIVIGKPFRFEQDESESDFVQRVHSWFIDQVSR